MDSRLQRLVHGALLQPRADLGRLRQAVPGRSGRGLAELLAAEFVEIPDSYTFIAEDQPERLVDALDRFLRADAR